MFVCLFVYMLFVYLICDYIYLICRNLFICCCFFVLYLRICYMLLGFWFVSVVCVLFCLFVLCFLFIT